MQLYSLLALTLLCGLLVVVGLIGSFQTEQSRGGTPVQGERVSDLKHGFVLLGVVTVVLFTIIALLIVQSEGKLPDGGWTGEVRMWLVLSLSAIGHGVAG